MPPSALKETGLEGSEAPGGLSRWRPVGYMDGQHGWHAGRPPAVREAGQAWSPLGTTRRKEAAQSGADKPCHAGAVLLGGPGTVALVPSSAPGNLAVACVFGL